MCSVSIAQATEIMFKNVSNYNLNIIFDTFKSEGKIWVPVKKIITLSPQKQSKMEHVTSFTVTATTTTAPFEKIDYTFKGTPEYINKLSDYCTLEINVDPKASFFNKPIHVEVVDYNQKKMAPGWDFFKNNDKNNEE